jgi:WhiB family redox-sensing transcriptional regulator
MNQVSEATDVSASEARKPSGERWQARGACQSAEPDLFFPLSETSASAAQIAAAKAVCAACPVRRECLRFALSAPQPHGIWGGLTEHERARLRRPGDLARPAPARRAAVLTASGAEHV